MSEAAEVGGVRGTARPPVVGVPAHPSYESRLPLDPTPSDRDVLGGPKGWFLGIPWDLTESAPDAAANHPERAAPPHTPAPILEEGAA